MIENETINKITTGFQVTIPAFYRKNHDLNVGDYLAFRQDGNRLIIEPFDSKKETLELFDSIFKKEIKKGPLSKLGEKKLNQVIAKEIKLNRQKKNVSKNRH